MKKRLKQMRLWVYIYEQKNSNFQIALSSSENCFLAIRQLNISILYLRPFVIPFDAIAHKYLLDSLSKKTVLNWIDKHRNETEAWLRIFDKNKA